VIVYEENGSKSKYVTSPTEEPLNNPSQTPTKPRFALAMLAYISGNILLKKCVSYTKINTQGKRKHVEMELLSVFV
jgi:hypothetical protein